MIYKLATRRWVVAFIAAPEAPAEDSEDPEEEPNVGISFENISPISHPAMSEMLR